MASQKKFGTIAIILLIGLLAGGGLLAYYRISTKIANSNKPALASVITVSTQTLKAEPIDQILTFQGIAEGDPQIKIYPKVNGKLQNLAVHEGQFVRSDQPLLLINRDIAGNDFMLAPVKSPINGVVTRLYFTDLGTELFPDKPVAEVADPFHLKITLNVGETDLLNIAAGQPAELWFIQDASRRLTGRVDSVTPFVDRETLTGGITIRANNPNQILKIGMNCSINITTGRQIGFMIPEEAIILGMGKSSVYLYQNGVARQVPITIAYSRNGRVEVTGRIHDGDQLIVDGAFKVYDNAVVQIGADKPVQDQ